MADYYPLVRNAIAALDEKTAEGRRVFYDRARVALINNLRKADPPVPETLIEQERLALEDALSKVEAEVSEGTQPIPSGLQTQSDDTEDTDRAAMMYRTEDVTVQSARPDPKEQRDRRFAFLGFLIVSAFWIGDLFYEPPTFSGWYDWFRLGGVIFLGALTILSCFIMLRNWSVKQEERAYIVWTAVMLVGTVLVTVALYFTFRWLGTTPTAGIRTLLFLVYPKK